MSPVPLCPVVFFVLLLGLFLRRFLVSVREISLVFARGPLACFCDRPSTN